MLNAIGIVFLALVSLNVVVELILTILNLRHLKSKAGELPDVLREHIDEKTYHRSTAYNADLGRLEIVETAVSFVLIIYFVYGGGFARIDALARTIDSEGRYLAALVFGASIFLIKFVADLPVSLYETFVVEERYEFNRMKPGLYSADCLKSLAVAAVIGIPVYLGMLWFMAATGVLWWFWCWCFVVVVQVTLLIVFPVWIAPLFNKFVPLEEGNLKNQIISLANHVGFPAQGIFVMDGSKRSRHSNAYFSGFGKKKRIILFDTLVRRLASSHILAVLAHEFGHYKMHHLRKLLLVNSTASLVILFGLSRLFHLEGFYLGFGFIYPSHYAALAIVAVGAPSLSFLATPFFSMVSRRFEYQADDYALGVLATPRAMAEVIVFLTKDNLANTNPHPWYSFFHYSHPGPTERINALQQRIEQGQR